MLVAIGFTVDSSPTGETLAVSTDRSPMDVSGAVSIDGVSPEGEVSYSIRYYEEPEDVANDETGDFHPGIEATPFHDWSFSAALLTDGQLETELATAQNQDFYFAVAAPELGRTLFGSGHTG